MKQAGLTTSLDTNDDPENLWANDVKTVLQSVDVFLPNEQEACKLAGTGDLDTALEALSRLVPIVVIKCGAQGAIAKRGKDRFHAASLSVQPVDTVGAGDSFNAGFLHKFIRGADTQECLEYGNASAGLSTTRAGGTEAFRDRQHRETFLQRCGKA
jgi:sugar/nucleoside kinase (ribokinase family)